MFSAFANWFSIQLGRASSFVVANLAILFWLLCGFHYGFSNDAYQFAMNSPVSIFTFLAVILIQHTQNAEAAKSVLRENALHLKIDELLLATEAARNELRGIEKLPESELQQVLEDDSPSDAPPS